MKLSIITATLVASLGIAAFQGLFVTGVAVAETARQLDQQRHIAQVSTCYNDFQCPMGYRCVKFEGQAAGLCMPIR